MAGAGAATQRPADRSSVVSGRRVTNAAAPPGEQHTSSAPTTRYWQVCRRTASLRGTTWLARAISDLVRLSRIADVGAEIRHLTVRLQEVEHHANAVRNARPIAVRVAHVARDEVGERRYERLVRGVEQVEGAGVVHDVGGIERALAVRNALQLALQRGRHEVRDLQRAGRDLGALVRHLLVEPRRRHQDALGVARARQWIAGDVARVAGRLA